MSSKDFGLAANNGSPGLAGYGPLQVGQSRCATPTPCQQAVAAANQANNELENANVATMKRAGLAFGGGCLWGMATGEVVDTPVAGTGLAPGNCLVGGIAAAGATVFGEVAYESGTWWNAAAAVVRAAETCLE